MSGHGVRVRGGPESAQRLRRRASPKDDEDAYLAAPVAELLRLQHSAGNAAVTSLVEGRLGPGEAGRPVVQRARPWTKKGVRTGYGPEDVFRGISRGLRAIKGLFESDPAEVASKMSAALAECTEVLERTEYLVPAAGRATWEKGRGYLEKIAERLESIVDWGETASVVSAFVDAVGELNEADAARDPAQAAKAFGALFASACALGLHLTPEGAPWAGYFTWLASAGSFFSDMRYGIDPSIRPRDVRHERAYEAEIEGSVGRSGTAR